MIFEYTLVTLYNLIFTSLPIIFLGKFPNNCKIDES